jgi:hypothetical protein
VILFPALRREGREVQDALPPPGSG